MWRKNDEQSKELIIFCNMFATLYVELLNFKCNNTVWDPNDTLPYNDLTKAYYDAVKFFSIDFKVSILKDSQKKQPNPKAQTQPPQNISQLETTKEKRHC